MAYFKMLREVLMLQTVCGGPNIMKLYDVIKESENGHPALVLEYVQSSDSDIENIYRNLTPYEVQFYMRELLSALVYVHKMEIMHRDIKFHNVLVDPSKKMLRLIDFGLALFYEPGKLCLQ